MSARFSVLVSVLSTVEWFYVTGTEPTYEKSTNTCTKVNCWVVTCCK